MGLPRIAAQKQGQQAPSLCPALPGLLAGWPTDVALQLRPHRAYVAPDTRANNPSYTCSIGYSPYTYDTYTGDTSSTQMQSSTYFKSTAKKNKCVPLGPQSLGTLLIA